MKTYQDLLACGSETDRMAFLLSAIEDHQASTTYKMAKKADLYYRHLNPTIMQAQKVVYDLMGRAHIDAWSANNKIPCRYYFYFITQTVQFLLGNGISFSNEDTKAKLGPGFERTVYETMVNALNGGEAYGLWDNDRLEPFSVLEFVPLCDEENGALCAGIRWWQIDDTKPLRVTLYELDGVTDYIKRDKDIEVLNPKRSYKTVVNKAEIGEAELYDGGNYPGFPVIPMFNINRQSELVGNQETLDAYDLMASALINNIDDANIIYWVIKNAGGMDDIDDEQFIQRLRSLHVVHLEGEEQVDSHSVTVPYEASETALEQLRSQLFDDFMALDVKNIAGGAATATQIKAAYEPLNSKADLLEWQVTEFIEKLLDLLGIDDTPTYTRSLLVNQQESITTLVTAADYLSSEYITRKVLEVMGDIDDAEEVLKQRIAEEANRYQPERDDVNG